MAQDCLFETRNWIPNMDGEIQRTTAVMAHTDRIWKHRPGIILLARPSQLALDKEMMMVQFSRCLELSCHTVNRLSLMSSISG